MQTANYRSRLTGRQNELLDRLRRIEGDLDIPRSNDDDDRATEREDEEVLESLGEAGLAELKAIEAALVRIDNGTYGRCAKCGRPMSEERLDAVPHAALCMECIAENAKRT
jgi:RNA polymerase-binding transcription factor DksA